MSYILDALKRAEAERARGQVPGLNAQPVTGAVPANEPRGMRPWHWALLALVALGVGGAGWWWFKPAAPVAVMAQGPGMDAPPVAVVAVPLPAPAPVVDVAPTPAPTPSPPPPKTKPETKPKEKAVAPAKAEPKPEPKAPAKAAATPPPPAPPPVPTLAALPDGIRASIPKLVLSGSVYSSSPSQRMVIVNGQVFHEGGSPAPDVTLERIGPRSAVLNFRGTQFSLPY